MKSLMSWAPSLLLFMTCSTACISNTAARKSQPSATDVKPQNDSFTRKAKPKKLSKADFVFLCRNIKTVVGPWGKGQSWPSTPNSYRPIIGLLLRAEGLSNDELTDILGRAATSKACSCSSTGPQDVTRAISLYRGLADAVSVALRNQEKGGQTDDFMLLHDLAGMLGVASPLIRSHPLE